MPTSCRDSPRARSPRSVERRQAHRRRARWQRRCDTENAPRSRIPHEGGDKHNGKESSEGRKEKGRQEAVTAASRQKRGRLSPPFLLVQQLSAIRYQLSAI